MIFRDSKGQASVKNCRPSHTFTKKLRLVPSQNTRCPSPAIKSTEGKLKSKHEHEILSKIQGAENAFIKDQSPYLLKFRHRNDVSVRAGRSRIKSSGTNPYILQCTGIAKNWNAKANTKPSWCQTGLEFSFREPFYKPGDRLIWRENINWQKWSHYSRMETTNTCIIKLEWFIEIRNRIIPEATKTVQQINYWNSPPNILSRIASRYEKCLFVHVL